MCLLSLCAGLASVLQRLYVRLCASWDLGFPCRHCCTVPIPRAVPSRFPLLIARRGKLRAACLTSCGKLTRPTRQSNKFSSSNFQLFPLVLFATAVDSNHCKQACHRRMRVRDTTAELSGHELSSSARCILLLRYDN